MAATKRNMNWTGVTYTPTAGTPTTITGVNNVKIDPGGKLLKYKGDANLFPTTIVNNDNEPTCTVTSADVATMQGFATGTVGTFTATLKDAKGATGGDIIYTIINAVVENTPAGANHAQWGDGTISFHAFSTDGTTSPVSFTRA